MNKRASNKRMPPLCDAGTAVMSYRTCPVSNACRLDAVMVSLDFQLWLLSSILVFFLFSSLLCHHVV